MHRIVSGIGSLAHGMMQRAQGAFVASMPMTVAVAFAELKTV
jgi:hypothetical protein